MFFFPFVRSEEAHQCDVDGELHADADRGDEDDHGDGAELDADQTHDAKELHRHHGQHKHLVGDTQGNYVVVGWLMVFKNRREIVGLGIYNGMIINTDGRGLLLKLWAPDTL